MPRVKALNNLLSCAKGAAGVVWTQGVLSSGTSVAISRISITMACGQRIFMGIDSNIDEKVGALTSDSNPLKRRRKMLAQHERGTTLVEVAIAGALLVLALASLYALYGTTVKEAKAGDTAAIAEQNSIARIDQIRKLNWYNATPPSNIATLLNTPTPWKKLRPIPTKSLTFLPLA